MMLLKKLKSTRKGGKQNANENGGVDFENNIEDPKDADVNEDVGKDGDEIIEISSDDEEGQEEKLRKKDKKDKQDGAVFLVDDGNDEVDEVQMAEVPKVPLVPYGVETAPTSAFQHEFPHDYGATLYARLMSELENGNMHDSTTLSSSSSSEDSKARKIQAKRLKKELKAILASTSVKNGVFTVDLHKGNICEWDVKLYDFDEDSKIAQDLLALEKKTGIDNVWVRVSIPEKYPFSPPFIRVLAPYVQSGYVMSGGAICMELLTPDGWSQAYRMEAVLQQVMSTIAKGDSRILKTVQRRLSKEEAERAYDYLVKAHKQHGWRNDPKHAGQNNQLQPKVSSNQTKPKYRVPTFAPRLKEQSKEKQRKAKKSKEKQRSRRQKQKTKRKERIATFSK